MTFPLKSVAVVGLLLVSYAKCSVAVPQPVAHAGCLAPLDRHDDTADGLLVLIESATWQDCQSQSSLCLGTKLLKV